MPSAVIYLLLSALLVGCAAPNIAGVTITGATFTVSESDIHEAIAASEEFRRTTHFRVTAVEVINHNEMRTFRKPNDVAWVFVTRKNGKWEYDGFGYVDR